MLQITDTARDRIKEILKLQKGTCLSIMFDGQGCCGPNLRMSLEEPKGNKTYIINEIEVLISESVLPYTNNTIIDYVVNAQGEGFHIESDGHDCGCH